jgi:GR25 family glycosyltransferase involved in LPS biosynthesis
MSPLNVSKFYYINMDRSVIRRDHFLNECQREKVPRELIERFSALDGNVHKFTDFENSLFDNCDFPRNPLKPQLMGNQLSHYYILKDIIKNGYPISVIFQDDAILRTNFLKILKKVIQYLPPDSEMLNIGFHKYGSGKNFIPWDMTREDDYKTLLRTLVNEHVGKIKHGVNPCSLSYIMTLQGAKNMVEFYETTGFIRATDGNFNDYLEQRDIFYGSAKVLVTGNHLFESTVFSNGQ